MIKDAHTINVTMPVFIADGEEGLKQQNGGGGGFNPFDVFSRFGQSRMCFTILIFNLEHRQAQQTGPEISMDIEMTLEELFSGASFDVFACVILTSCV